MSLSDIHCFCFCFTSAPICVSQARIEQAAIEQQEWLQLCAAQMQQQAEGQYYTPGVDPSVPGQSQPVSQDQQMGQPFPGQNIMQGQSKSSQNTSSAGSAAMVTQSQEQSSDTTPKPNGNAAQSPTVVSPSGQSSSTSENSQPQALHGSE